MITFLVKQTMSDFESKRKAMGVLVRGKVVRKSLVLKMRPQRISFKELPFFEDELPTPLPSDEFKRILSMGRGLQPFAPLVA